MYSTAAYANAREVRERDCEVMVDKICLRCQRAKPLEEFHRDTQSPDGRHTHCKDCRRPQGAEPKQGKNDKLRKICFLYDLHVSDNDLLATAAVFDLLQDEQFDEIILGGDFLELESVSQHGTTADLVRLSDDFAAGQRFLTELRKVAPEATITYLEGNHETRLTRTLTAAMPQLVSALSVTEGLKLDKYGIAYVPEDKQPIQRGTLQILHGHQLTSGTSRGLPARCALKAADVYGRPGQTVVFGHAHKDQVDRKVTYGGNVRGVCLGCLRTINPGWMHGSVSGWCHQIGVAYIRPGGIADLYIINITNGAFAWNGKMYVGKRHA